MSDCVFCRIVAGDAPASFVHRDALVSGFLDIRPMTPGHLLVIPNEHIDSVRDLPDPTANRLFAVARHLARTLRETDAVRADGVNLIVADGEAAGQEVFHAHAHVIPRFPADGFEFAAAGWRSPPPTRDELDAMAERIRPADVQGGIGAVRWVRPIVIGLAIRGDQILANEGYDHHKGERFYRPPGGGMEFGETSEDTLRREFREELNAEIVEAGYVGALENVFVFAGQPGHEIVLVYRVELAHDDRFTSDTVAGTESDGSRFTARWLPLADARTGAARLYPEGLLELLDARG
jgi:histidine triad (HIT) family protein